MALITVLGCATPSPSGAGCEGSAVAVQVLGSGGPIPDSTRASSGYLIWIDGRARVMVDTGGGTFLRFGESGARIEDVDLIAVTHFHTDHAADLPAILKGGFFASRSRPLAVSGPTGSGLFPSLEDFLKGNFGPTQGTFRYLSGFLDGSGGLFALQPVAVDADATNPFEVFRGEDLQVQAVGVHHGPVPTLGYLFTVGNRRIAISGDQNLSSTSFLEMAQGANLVVMPFAIPEDADPVARNLHATPSDIGKAAARMAPGRLVLSHFMARSLRDLDANLEHVRQHYQGELALAEDLQCFPVSGG